MSPFVAVGFRICIVLQYVSVLTVSHFAERGNCKTWIASEMSACIDVVYIQFRVWVTTMRGVI